MIRINNEVLNRVIAESVRKVLAEAQFVSMYGKGNVPDNDIFYQDGDFTISNDKIRKYRGTFNPHYDRQYGRDKDKILHQMAFEETIRMLDNGKKLPSLGDIKIYHSLLGKGFSKKQVDYVEEKYVRPKYENMTIEELYDTMHINMQRDIYLQQKKGKQAISQLLNKGFFDTYLNGMAKDLALWNLGKVKDVTGFIGWLYSKNRFLKKTNRQAIMDAMEKTMDEIADSKDSFTGDKVYMALSEMTSSLNKLDMRG